MACFCLYILPLQLKGEGEDCFKNAGSSVIFDHDYMTPLALQVQERNVKDAALQNADLFVDHGSVLVLQDKKPT